MYPVYSMTVQGIRGHLLSVECDLSQGLPQFILSGLPDAAVTEARDRVRAAIKNTGFVFPACRITVNLAPSNIKKVGTFFDLPILISILCAGNQLAPKMDSCAFIGELSLQGELRPTSGILPMALEAKRQNIKHMFVPTANAREATLAEGPLVYPVSNVEELVLHLMGEKPIDPAPLWVPPVLHESTLDFKDVKGQEIVKHAMEVAAAGGHNLLMTGPPGSGKSMLARRLSSILPDMTRQESLDATEIHSILSMTNHENPLISQRPFRAPHHTTSAIGLAGGGSVPKPGEISLAHNGVLFLDELPEFSKEVIEVLRQPIEDGIVQISRASGTAIYPCEFMLICAMNPCRCGWFGDVSGRCTCNPKTVEKYLSKISGPMLDRIDLFVKVAAVSYEDLSRKSEAETSAQVKERVDKARTMQIERYKNNRRATDQKAILCNAQMGERELEEFAILSEECNKLLELAFRRFGMTGRSHARVLRLSRTIADLEGSEEILPDHIKEALYFRPPDYLKR